MSGIQIGVYVWGSITILIAAILLGLVLCAAFHLTPDGSIREGTHWLLAGALKAVETYGSMLGALVGFSGLAWANFFQASSRSPSDSKAEVQVAESVND
jgi:hypothetical protein